MTLTLDSQVLWIADDPAASECLRVNGLMNTMYEGGHALAVDQQGRIEAEYRNLAQDGHAFHWVCRMRDGNQIHRKDGKVDDRPRRRLMQELDFDRNDLPFVGVASTTDSKLLVAYESDYTPEVRQYLTDCQLGVTVCCAGEAEAECQACT